MQHEGAGSWLLMCAVGKKLTAVCFDKADFHKGAIFLQVAALYMKVSTVAKNLLPSRLGLPCLYAFKKLISMHKRKLKSMEITALNFVSPYPSKHRGIQDLLLRGAGKIQTNKQAHRLPRCELHFLSSP